MKKTLTMVGLGACVLLAFPSCKSTDDDGFEEALPMSVVGDDESAPWESEIPDWLKEDNSNAPQVSAGETTILPAPDEPVANVSTRQNRPDVAVTDDIIVSDTPVAGVDPLSGTPISEPATTPVPTPKPISSTPAATSSGKSSGAGKKTAATTKKKPAKKLSQPTLVVYKVRKGDSLSTIAKRSNTTVAQIRKDSGIKGDLIHPGQIIKVRYTPKGYKAPAKSDKAAKGNKGAKGGKTTTPAKGATTYTVRNGETISGIAKKNGVSTAALLKANGMTSADAAKMRPGKKLTIPKK